MDEKRRCNGRTRRGAVRLSVALGLVWGLVACASAPPAEPPPPTTKTVFVGLEASASANPNAEGRASPTTVKVFALADLDVFRRTDFFALFDNPGGALGADLIMERSLVLAPGDKTGFAWETPIDLRHIGVVAGFRDVDAGGWRADALVTNANARFVLDGSAISGGAVFAPAAPADAPLTEGDARNPEDGAADEAE
ncbi:MAG: type VI secretion system lipoprotein TssJ [Maricaulaceae bacterium]